MKTTPFLIAHTGPSGRGIAQATIVAKSESAARSQFAVLFPERIITTTGIREGRAPTRRERSWR